MSLPNFLLIGAQKAGTSSLHHYLRQHPDIFMPGVKEPSFFNLEGLKLNPAIAVHRMAIQSNVITRQEDYEALFTEASSEKAVGEASTGYLTSPRAARNIKRMIPDAKLIAVLRNPSERTYSNYLMYLRHGLETVLDFERALKEGAKSDEHNSAYVPFGYYGRQLKVYYDLFDQKQIKVYLYEDLKADATKLTQDMYRFLGVDDSFVPNISKKLNVSAQHPPARGLARKAGKILARNLARGVPRKWLHFVDNAAARFGFEYWETPPLTREARQWLINTYRDDILLLQDLIGRDLSAWC